jgi:ElaB/YqjD/DUF883 family membrane-anchored ribosome-binding protein
MSLPTETILVMDAELTELVETLAELRARKRVLADEESKTRDKIMAALRSAEATVGFTAAGSQAIRIETQARQSVNSAKLKAMFPEIHAQVLEASEVTMLRLG